MKKPEQHEIRAWRWGRPWGFQESRHPLSGLDDPREAVKQGIISEWSICGMSRPEALAILSEPHEIWWNKWGWGFWWRVIDDHGSGPSGRYMAEGTVTVLGTQEQEE